MAGREGGAAEEERRRRGLRHTIEKVVVLRRTGNDVPWTDDRDVWWHDLVEGRSADCPPEAMVPRTCSTCSTPRGPRPSPRGSCTPPAST